MRVRDRFVRKMSHSSHPFVSSSWRNTHHELVTIWWSRKVVCNFVKPSSFVIRVATPKTIKPKHWPAKFDLWTCGNATPIQNKNRWRGLLEQEQATCLNKWLSTHQTFPFFWQNRDYPFKFGSYMGHDAAGNRYYENRVDYPFGQHRWVSSNYHYAWCFN